MEAEYELLAEQTKQKVEDIQKRIMSNPESLSQTTTKLLGQKTMNFIYSNCEFEFYKEDGTCILVLSRCSTVDNVGYRCDDELIQPPSKKMLGCNSECGAIRCCDIRRCSNYNNENGWCA